MCRVILSILFLTSTSTVHSSLSIVSIPHLNLKPNFRLESMRLKLELLLRFLRWTHWFLWLNRYQTHWWIGRRDYCRRSSYIRITELDESSITKCIFCKFLGAGTPNMRPHYFKFHCNEMTLYCAGCGVFLYLYDDAKRHTLKNCIVRTGQRGKLYDIKAVCTIKWKWFFMNTLELVKNVPIHYDQSFLLLNPVCRNSIAIFNKLRDLTNLLNDLIVSR